jgi:hypothetical protein
MYTFIILKLLNYFQVIEISFDFSFDYLNHKKTYLNIIGLIVCYLIIIAATIFMYNKVLNIKIGTLKNSGKSSSK